MLNRRTFIFSSGKAAALLPAPSHSLVCAHAEFYLRQLAAEMNQLEKRGMR
jgi:hypothetical protein